MITYSENRRGNASGACEYAANNTAVSLAGLERKSGARCSGGVSGTCASGIPSTSTDQAALVSSAGVGLEETLAGERTSSSSWGWCGSRAGSRAGRGRGSASGVLDEVLDACGRAGGLRSI